VDNYYIPHLWKVKRSSDRQTQFYLKNDYALIRLSRSPGKVSIKMRSAALSRRSVLSFSGKYDIQSSDSTVYARLSPL
jgi:hypothetical protein